MEVETGNYLASQKILGVQEAARQQNIDLEEERRKAAEAKAKEDADRAAFWKAYDLEHNKKAAKIQAAEDARAQAEAKAQAEKERKEAQEKAEKQAAEEK